MKYLNPDHSLIFVENGSGVGIDLVVASDDDRFSHYADMMPAPYIAHVIVPISVSRFQAKAALLSVGVLGDVEEYISEADAITKLAWSECMEWRRDSPMVNGIGAALGMTSDEIDDLFITASGIVA